MRSFITRLSTLLLLSAFGATTQAQSFTIPASINTSAFPAINSCSNCTITLDPGVVLTVNSNVSCSNCTFIGGTIIFASGTVTLGSTTTFKNDTVLINHALNIQSMNFNGDSVAINAAVTYSMNGTTVTNSAVSVAASLAFNSATLTNDRIYSTAAISSNGLTVSGTTIKVTGTTVNATATTITGSNITLNGTSTWNTNSALTTTGSHFTLSSASTLTSSGAMTMTGGAITSAGKIKSGGALTLAGDTVTLTGGYMAGSSVTTKANGTISTLLTLSGGARDSTNGTMTMTNTDVALLDSAGIKGSSLTYSIGSISLSYKSFLAPANALTLTTATVTMNDSSYITAGSMTIQTGSYVTIGDGSSTSMANINVQNALKVLDTSTLAISGHKNYFTTNSGNFTGGTHSYSSSPNINCGGPSQNACQAKFTFGCATMNASGAIACVVLAAADLQFSARPSANNTVNLVWSDPQYSTADHYLVERNSAGSDWTTLTTIAAGGYDAGNYHFEDASAPAGTNFYRIVRVDHDGATLYSATSSVTLAPITTGISIFPNPATGHTFNLATPDSKPFILNIYTLTGQLVMRTTLRGQTQYPVRLPAQLLPGSTVIVQTIEPKQTTSFPLLLR
jgi:hypothetical protein